MRSSTLLSNLKDAIQSIIASVNTDFISLDDAELNFKRSAEIWSILECFEHLNRYNRFYNHQFENAIASSRFKNVPDEAHSTWLGKKFITMMHPETMKKSKTLKHMNPLNSKLDRSVLEEFLSHQHQLLLILKNAGHVDLNKVKIPVEFLRILKMNLGDALQFVVVHEQRHLKQAIRLVKPERPLIVV